MKLRVMLALMGAALCGCTPGSFSATRNADGTYVVELSACMGTFDNEKERAELMARLTREASAVCRSGKPILGAPQTVRRGWYGSPFGECPLKAFVATLVCE